MDAFRSKYNPLPGSSHAEVFRAAREEYRKIQSLTPRRQAYIRSKYFRNDKVFINQLWTHTTKKHYGDQMRRVKLFNCAIDLLRNSTVAPETIFSKGDLNTMLHRFYGDTKDGKLFCVQVRENKRTGRKYLMSVFPDQKTK